ncbi:MAG: sigma-70 family RNA polymerase sigma factor [Muribaculaceae bacterium]|nr:sigma-70 family RNA polymerase sigma factor [Muribaculaceae bacterium]
MRKRRVSLLSDDILWSSFLLGDVEAYSELFYRFSDAMFCYGCKFTGDRELVKDCIQDTFVKLINSREKLIATNNNIKAYLFVALKRIILASMERNVSTLSISDFVNDDFIVEISDNDQCENVLPEQRAALKKAIGELTPRQREAIYLYYIQEIPLKDIPALLDMNYQSTRNLLHRAMLKLRTNLNDSQLGIAVILTQCLSM